MGVSHAWQNVLRATREKAKNKTKKQNGSFAHTHSYLSDTTQTRSPEVGEGGRGGVTLWEGPSRASTATVMRLALRHGPEVGSGEEGGVSRSLRGVLERELLLVMQLAFFLCGQTCPLPL